MKQVEVRSPNTAVLALSPERGAQLAPAPTVGLREPIDAIETEIRSVFQRYAGGVPEFWGMPAYHMGWADFGAPPAIPGKRIRPLLTVLSAQGAGGDWRHALPLAAAVELLHSFSLVHDDIQDGSAQRRGRPSVWAKWGVGHAINAGDTLFALAHLAVQHAASLPSERRLAALGLLDQACVRLAEGQYLDMAFEQWPDVSLADYMDMIEGKTAALTGLATELGGLAANADAQTVAHLKQLGVHIGLAFQVRDDILGIWGDPAATGKPSSDIRARKKTLPLVHGLQASAELRVMFEAEGEIDAPHVMELLEKGGSLAYAVEMLHQQAGQAFRHLRAALPWGEASRTLHTLIAGLLPDIQELVGESNRSMKAHREGVPHA